MEEKPVKSDNHTPSPACDLDASDEDGFIDLENIPSPVLRVLSPEVAFDVSSVSCNRKETKDCPDVLSAFSVSATDSLEAEISSITSESGGFEHSKTKPTSPIVIHMVHSPKVSFDSSKLFNVGDSSTQSDTASVGVTPTVSFPKICFDPSTLILKSPSPQARNDEMDLALPELSFDSAVESLENANPAERPRVVTSDLPCPLKNLPSSSSHDDTLQLVPAKNTKTLDSNDQQVVHSNLSVDHRLQAAEEGNNVKPNTELRSILKYQKPMSSIEKLVANCLNLICATGDKHEAQELIRSSITEVFKGLCFDQFFRKGECFSSSCDDNHNYKTRIFYHSEKDLWNASLYVICHAAVPNRQIVENLIQHYTAKGDVLRVLLFTKCIAKVREVDRLELAHFIVNKLSHTIPMRDVITVILMLNLSELPYKRYNILMEDLRVFKQNTTNYGDLMTFLNSHGYQMPVDFIVKLMKDSMEYSHNDSMAESISGFLRRLHPSQKDKVQSMASDFRERFGVPSDYVDCVPSNERSQIKKRKVSFAPHVCEVEIPYARKEADDEADLREGVFSDEDSEEADDARPPNPIFYGSPVLLADRIALVFGGSCGTWMLSGQCSDPVCSLTHNFNKDSLASLSIEDVYLAADFILTQSISPSFEILKIFIESLAESKAFAKVLKLRNLTLNLSYQDSVKLTKLVISSLEKHMGRWEAIEKVLVPNIVELSDVGDNQQFSFDHEVLYSIMSKAIESKTPRKRCVTNLIMHLAAELLPRENTALDLITYAYIDNFMTTERELPSSLDIPCLRIEQNTFASDLKVSLYQGAPSKYFLATLMMKQAINGCLRDQALDVLDTFLLSNFDRARVLSHLLENCNYFNAKTKRSVVESFGIAGFKTGIQLYEEENFADAAELFNVLKIFMLDMFNLPESYKIMTDVNLAIIYCSVTVDTVYRNDTIDIFLDRVVDPYLLSASSACPPELMNLTAKMFRVFTTALLVEESLRLYKGIIHRQKSLVSPLNIAPFVESTFRCTFHQLMDDEVRKEILRLYLEVTDCEPTTTFQKVTHRTMFLITLKEITCASLISREKGGVNILHPLMKKMLFRCIKEGVYHDVKTLQPTMYSSMTAEEMKVYLLWWFALYVRGRKRLAINYFSPLPINIIHEIIQDDCRLPMHPSLRRVPTSITECAERLASVIKNIIREPLSTMPSRGRGVVELHPSTVRALSQTALNLISQHGYITAESDRLCIKCFDKLSVDLGKGL